MKNKALKSLCFVLSVVLLCSILGSSLSACSPLFLEERADYVIITDNYEEIKPSLAPSSTHTPISSEKNLEIITASLTESEAESLKSEGSVVAVEENVIFTADGAQGEKPYSKEKLLWNAKMINSLGYISNSPKKRARIGIMDSGINSGAGLEVAYHSELSSEEGSFLFPDSSGHGTSVASVIGSKKLGIKPNAELYSIKVLNSQNTASLADIIKGIYWAIDNGINILNMSFGSTTYSEALQAAISDAYAEGLLIIASAGNAGKIRYPAAFPNVIAVGSLDCSGKVISTNWNEYESIIFAPGEGVPSAGEFDSPTLQSGTSMAAPHITALAAELWERDLNKSNGFIRDLLFSSANSSLGAFLTADLKNALKSYKSFAKTYKASPLQKTMLSQEKVQTSAKSTFTALWKRASHKEALGGSIFSERELKLIKVFSTLPDNKNITFPALFSKRQPAEGFMFTSYFEKDGKPLNLTLTNNESFSSKSGLHKEGSLIDFGLNKSLHARQNYVASLKFLYEVARNLWYGNYYKRGLEKDKIILEAMKSALPPEEVGAGVSSFYGDTHEYGYPKFSLGKRFEITEIIYTQRCTAKHQLLNLQKMIYLAANCRCDALALDYKSSNNLRFQKESALKILGLALHLIGDIYAHRTVIPPLGTSGAIRTAKGSQLAPSKTDKNYLPRLGDIQVTLYSGSKKKDFNIGDGRWSGKHGLKKVILGGKYAAGGAEITTRQVSYLWQKSGKKHRQADYEDNINFLPNRYKYTRESLRELLRMFRENEKFSVNLFKVLSINPIISGAKIQRLADLRKFSIYCGEISPEKSDLKFYDSKPSISDEVVSKAPTGKNDPLWFTPGFQLSG